MNCWNRELMEEMPNYYKGKTYLRYKCYEYECPLRDKGKLGICDKILEQKK